MLSSGCGKCCKRPQIKFRKDTINSQAIIMTTRLVKAKQRISKLGFQEIKARQIFRKTNISYPLIRNVRFSKTPVLRFALLLNYQRTTFGLLFTTNSRIRASSSLKSSEHFLVAKTTELTNQLL